MDREQKQKVLLGVLAVLILGAGSFWYMSREPAQENKGSATRTSRERLQREATHHETKVRKEREQQAPRERTDYVPQTREREEVKTSTRRDRSHTRKIEKKKKKEMAPAA